MKLRFAPSTETSMFRQFMVIRILLLLLSLGLKLLLYEKVSPYELLAGADAVILIGYLSLAPLQGWLKRAYFPLALVVASTMPIYMQHLIGPQNYGLRNILNIILAIAHSDNPLRHIGQSWVLFDPSYLQVTLFIALVMVSWKYDFRMVLLFCIVTALLDYLFILELQDDQPIFFTIRLGLMTTRTMLFVLIGYIMVQLLTLQRRQENELAQAHRRLAEYASTLEQLTISRERNRLARELHDTLAHTLSATSVQLEAASAAWQDDSLQAHHLVKQSLALVRDGLGETRRALQALRASPLDDLGLVQALHHLADSTGQQAGFRATCEIDPQTDQAAPPIAQCLYRVAQEALTNVARHASATQVTLLLCKQGKRLELKIVDNGMGFNFSEVDMQRHFGLAGMRERMEMLGGQLKIESQQGAGTTITAFLEGDGR